MNRADLEIILLKHDASEALRREILNWAFDGPIDQVTQTFCSALPPSTDDGNMELTLALGDPDRALHRNIEPVTPHESPRWLHAKKDGDEWSVYEDLCLLGAGGMGEVRLVKDLTLHRTLAMKIMSSVAHRSPNLRRRFEEEALVSAQLQHPNIVPVHEVGVLRDGRLYFTMREVKGVSLEQAIAQMHHLDKDDSKWNLHKLVDAFAQVCHAVAYAHSKGILHRDLKPSNIMLGEFGEVLVVDWGVAKFMEDVINLDLMRPDDMMSLIEFNDVWGTQVGYVVGTPAYMSPEQASGELGQVTERSDIYALGAILYKILSGQSPYEGESGQDVLEKVRTQAPVSVLEAALTNRHAPEPMDKDGIAPLELIEICECAMSRHPKDRYASAQIMAQALSDWLDGSKRVKQAKAVVQAAKALHAERAMLEASAKQNRHHSKSLLSKVPSWAGEKEKSEGWAFEENANQAESRIRRLDIEGEQLLQAALTHADLEEAHEALAMHYYEAHRQAEASLNAQEMESQAIRLEKHVQALSRDNPAHKRLTTYLKGTGRLSIDTTEAGVHVVLERYEPYQRRLIPKFVTELGRTPIVNYPIEMGSYRLRLNKEGYHELLYPVCIERGMHWDGRDADGVLQKIKMWPTGTLSTDECLVSAGWFWAGQYPKRFKTLSRRRCWLGDFAIQRFHVTNAQYVEFLNDLLAQGREEEALNWVPQERGGRFGERGAMIYSRDDRGQFRLGADSDGDIWEPNSPVCMVSWYSAQAYAQWRKDKTGLPWQMVDELAWSKAGRGVDGRIFPWGNRFDPSYCCVRDSREGPLKPPLIHEFEHDESVYGVRGMAGGMSDWTATHFHEDWGAPVQANRVIARGGHWLSGEPPENLAYRVDGIPAFRIDRLGFRLMRWL